MNDESDWIPGAIDNAWIEAISPPLSPVAAAIQAAADPHGIPIVDRAVGRMLNVLAVGRSRIVEIGTAYGYSTLWMALAQGPDGTIVTVDPDRGRTDLARRWWHEAGVADARIVQVSAAALDAFAADEAALAGPFDLAFIDAVKVEYDAYLDALIDGHRLAPGALVVADNVLWGGAVSGARPSERSDAATRALRSFCERVLADRRFSATILPIGDGLLVAAWRGASADTGTGAP